MKTFSSYHHQIQGFEDVSATVKVVEKIAASSVHVLKQDVLALNTYVRNLEQTLAELALFYPKATHPFVQAKPEGKRALILFTGDKGLVGGLWHKMINLYLEKKETYQAVFLVGEKGKRYLAEERIEIASPFSVNDRDTEDQKIDRLMQNVFEAFRQGTWSHIDIAYPKFISLVEQEPTILPFLPFSFRPNKTKETAIGIPIFEPSRSHLFETLIQKYIDVFFRGLVMEAALSEDAARMIAMEHASQKTDEFVDKFKFAFRKDRRRSITQKQLERFSAHKHV